MNADVLLKALRDNGFGLFSGVPCSYLTPLINAVIDSPDACYINAANEGEAVAICSGAELGGIRSVAMFQNSGLGNAVSPLMSLNAIFRIPILLDNGVHDSTGAQSTLSNAVNIPAIAAACGYPDVEIARTPDQLRSMVGSRAPSLRLIYVRTRPRSDRKLPRPTITPDQVANRFRLWLHGE